MRGPGRRHPSALLGALSGALLGALSGAFGALFLVAACDEPLEVPSGHVGDGEVGRIMVLFGADPLRYRRDAWDLDSARIENDTLRLHVRHGGGCERHRYALVAWNGWLESNPVQAGVLLAHDSRGDACRALLFPVLRFDLAPLREAYLRAYGGQHGTVVLRLSDPVKPAAGSVGTVRWSF